MKCWFLHQNPKSCWFSRWELNPHPFGGPVLCGASLGTASALAASLETPQFAAREDLAHCPHVRDGERIAPSLYQT